MFSVLCIVRSCWVSSFLCSALWMCGYCKKSRMWWLLYTNYVQLLFHNHSQELLKNGSGFSLTNKKFFSTFVQKSFLSIFFAALFRCVCVFFMCWKVFSFYFFFFFIVLISQNSFTAGRQRITERTILLLSVFINFGHLPNLRVLFDFSIFEKKRVICTLRKRVWWHVGCCQFAISENIDNFNKNTGSIV